MDNLVLILLYRILLILVVRMPIWVIVESSIRGNKCPWSPRCLCGQGRMVVNAIRGRGGGEEI